MYGIRFFPETATYMAPVAGGEMLIVAFPALSVVPVANMSPVIVKHTVALAIGLPPLVTVTSKS